MILRLLLIVFVGFFVSCSNFTTKRTPTRPSPKSSGTKIPVGAAGMAANRPPELAPVAILKELPVAEITPTKDPMTQLKEYVTLSVQAPNKADQELYRTRAIEVVESKLKANELENVADDSDYGYLRGHAMFRLGELSLEERKLGDAQKYFSTVVEFLPGSDLAGRSQDILDHLAASKNVSPQTIGVIVPLSGKTAPVGQRALRGLEMGLGLHIPGTAFKLAVMDSEGNPDSARRGVERLVKEDNVIAIVGSLLSKTAPAVAAKADELGVPSIGLSQRSGLTEIGPSVFRNSLTTGMQVQQLVRTSMEDLGMKKFAILYPNDFYGTEFSNIFWDEVLARGGQVTAVQSYSTKETDFRLVIQRLVGTYYGEARQEEFNLRLKELQHTDRKRSVRQSNLEMVLPPLVDFDAIFIPDSAKAMGQVAAMLAYNDVRNVKLLGTNLWNTKDIARRAGNFANNLIFVDSLVPGIVSQSRFASEYRSVYGEEPSLIEFQAYDAGLILRQLIASGADDREELRKKLTSLQAFPGALGTLRLSPEREIERPVFSLTVEKGEIVPLRIRK